MACYVHSVMRKRAKLLIKGMKEISIEDEENALNVKVDLQHMKR